MPTTNPVPSQDPSDLLFNAGKLDEVLNGTGTSFTDRLGTARRTVAGMNADFDAQLADAESDLNVYRADAAASAAEALGYLQTIRATSYGAYASDPATDPLGNPPTVGDEYFNTTANLLKRWNGTTWQASDINTANLAAPSGSSLVGYDTGTVQDVLDGAKTLQDYAALRAYTGRAKRIYITGLLVTKKPDGITGTFQHDPTDTTSLDNGATIIVLADGRRFKRDYSGAVQLGWFDINTTGSTPSTSAVQAAIDLLKSIGGVIEAPVGTITIGSINCTGIQKSITLRGASMRDTVFSIKSTDGIGFDCVGSQFLEFENFTISGNATETPKAGFLFARNSTNASAGRCRLRSIQSSGFFSVSPVYNYAAEEFKAYDCYFTNNSINASVIEITRNNRAGITSTFASIATGSQSTTEYNLHNCAFNNYAVSGNGACIRLAGVSSASFTGETFMISVGSGNKYVVIDASEYSSSSIKFDSVMLDGDRTSIYGFYISGNIEVSNIEIKNVLDYGIDSVNGFMVFGADLSQISYSEFKNFNTAAKLRFYTLKYSDVSHPMKGVELAYSISKCSILADSSKFVFSRPDLSSGNRIDFADLGYGYRRSGATSPYAVVTPNSVGEEYLQTSTPPVIWKAAGLTNSTWGVTAAQPLQGAGSPITVVTPRYTGDEYRDTTNNAWYKSHGTTASAWTKLSN